MASRVVNNSVTLGRNTDLKDTNIICTVIIVTWNYTSNQTDGLIEKRYANQDASGKVKESTL
jgi:hypothetical protein